MIDLGWLYLKEQLIPGLVATQDGNPFEPFEQLVSSMLSERPSEASVNSSTPHSAAIAAEKLISRQLRNLGDRAGKETTAIRFGNHHKMLRPLPENMTSSFFEKIWIDLVLPFIGARELETGARVATLAPAGLSLAIESNSLPAELLDPFDFVSDKWNPTEPSQMLFELWHAFRERLETVKSNGFLDACLLDVDQIGEELNTPPQGADVISQSPTVKTLRQQEGRGLFPHG